MSLWNSPRFYIWRTRVTPELKKELAESGCTIRLHEDT